MQFWKETFENSVSSVDLNSATQVQLIVLIYCRCGVKRIAN